MLGAFVFIIIILAIFAPEAFFLLFAFLGIVGYGFLEFILRLFGKSFEGSNLSREDVNSAYINYIRSSDSNIVRYDYESFSEECNKNESFYKKYKKH